MGSDADLVLEQQINYKKKRFSDLHEMSYN